MTDVEKKRKGNCIECAFDTNCLVEFHLHEKYRHDGNGTCIHNLLAATTLKIHCHHIKTLDQDQFELIDEISGDYWIKEITGISPQPQRNEKVPRRGRKACTRVGQIKQQ